MLVARAKCGACGASGSRGTAHRGYARAKVSAQAEPADDRGRHRGRPAGAQAAQSAKVIEGEAVPSLPPPVSAKNS
jgi:hypothetical protein